MLKSCLKPCGEIILILAKRGLAGVQVLNSAVPLQAGILMTHSYTLFTQWRSVIGLQSQGGFRLLRGYLICYLLNQSLQT